MTTEKIEDVILAYGCDDELAQADPAALARLDEGDGRTRARKAELEHCARMGLDAGCQEYGFEARPLAYPRTLRAWGVLLGCSARSRKALVEAEAWGARVADERARVRARL